MKKFNKKSKLIKTKLKTKSKANRERVVRQLKRDIAVAQIRQSITNTPKSIINKHLPKAIKTITTNIKANKDISKVVSKTINTIANATTRYQTNKQINKYNYKADKEFKDKQSWIKTFTTHGRFFQGFKRASEQGRISAKDAVKLYLKQQTSYQGKKVNHYFIDKAVDKLFDISKAKLSKIHINPNTTHTFTSLLKTTNQGFSTALQHLEKYDAKQLLNIVSQISDIKRAPKTKQTIGINNKTFEIHSIDKYGFSGYKEKSNINYTNQIFTIKMRVGEIWSRGYFIKDDYDLQSFSYDWKTLHQALEDLPTQELVQATATSFFADNTGIVDVPLYAFIDDNYESINPHIRVIREYINAFDMLKEEVLNAKH